jgi:hypothetical protein
MKLKSNGAESELEASRGRLHFVHVDEKTFDRVVALAVVKQEELAVARSAVAALE